MGFVFVNFMVNNKSYMTAFYINYLIHLISNFKTKQT